MLEMCRAAFAEIRASYAALPEDDVLQETADSDVLVEGSHGVHDRTAKRFLRGSNCSGLLVERKQSLKLRSLPLVGHEFHAPNVQP
jgi:hypothetical protein